MLSEVMIICRVYTIPSPEPNLNADTLFLSDVEGLSLTLKGGDVSMKV